MPIYEYLCRDCKNMFEIYQNLTEEESIICPQCQSKEVERRPSTFMSQSSRVNPCSPEGRFT